MENFSMRALYTQIQFPAGKRKGQDQQAYLDAVRQSENLLNQNFLTIQQQVGEISAAISALQEWAKQF